MELPGIFLKPKTLVLQVVLIPLFVLLFMVVYKPLFGTGLSEMIASPWEDHHALCMPIISAILLTVMLVSRLVMYLVSHEHTLTTLHYLYWLLAEFLACCLFVDLFVSLFFHEGYFEILSALIYHGLLLLSIPHVFFWIFLRLRSTESELEQCMQQVVEMQQGMERSEPGTVRFVDEKGNVKLILGVMRIYYVESAGNYVTIVYENHGQLTRYALRNTLKGIEDVCASNDLIRCHRSYFINIHKIRLLRKESDFMYAEMDFDNIDDIPVSKTYAKEVMAHMAQMS